MPGHYVFSTVLFSIVTAILSGFVAFEAAGRTRTSSRPLFWILTGGVTLGLGIWSMHFIGMLAWQPPFPLFYTLWRTLLSVVVAIAASCLAMLLVTRTDDPRAARAFGALLVGAGICSMHYIGMSALRFSPPAMWMPGWVILSFLIAIGASGLAMALLRAAPAPGVLELQRQVAGSLVIGVAICGMHYVGMQAMMLAPGSTCLHLPGSFAGPALARAGVGNALIFMLALLVFSYYDKVHLSQLASEAKQQAEQARIYAERLEAAGKIAASVAHEVNNPLEAVTNLLYLLQMSELGPPEREYLSMAQRELRRIAEITTHSLKFYRQQSAAEPTALPELFESALALFTSRIESRGVVVERAWPDDLAPLMCRAGELRQVFANLISNAIDALPEQGGSVRLSIFPGPEGATIEVADTGRGIPSAARDKIFEPFFTTKGPAGTGLGLAISSEIVARHGGELTFTTSTEPGSSGTTFRVSLPARYSPEAGAPFGARPGILHQPLPAVSSFAD